MGFLQKPPKVVFSITEPTDINGIKKTNTHSGFQSHRTYWQKWDKKNTSTVFSVTDPIDRNGIKKTFKPSSFQYHRSYWQKWDKKYITVVFRITGISIGIEQKIHPQQFSESQVQNRKYIHSSFQDHRVNFVCWLLFSIHSNPVLLQWQCRWQVTPKHAYTLDPVKSKWADYATVQAQCGNLSGNSSHTTCHGAFSLSRLSLLSHFGLILA